MAASTAPGLGIEVPASCLADPDRETIMANIPQLRPRFEDPVNGTFDARQDAPGDATTEPVKTPSQQSQGCLEDRPRSPTACHQQTQELRSQSPPSAPKPVEALSQLSQKFPAHVRTLSGNETLSVSAAITGNDASCMPPAAAIVVEDVCLDEAMDFYCSSHSDHQAIVSSHDHQADDCNEACLDIVPAMLMDSVDADGAGEGEHVDGPTLSLPEPLVPEAPVSPMVRCAEPSHHDASHLSDAYEALFGGAACTGSPGLETDTAAREDTVTLLRHIDLAQKQFGEYQKVRAPAYTLQARVVVKVSGGVVLGRNQELS
jgi:hypothetical protein